MAFYQDGQQIETLTISGVYNPGTEVVGAITLYNNTEVTISLAGIQVNTIQDIKNPDQVSVMKIVVEWGDGQRDVLAPPVGAVSSSINVTPQPWDTVSHLYALEEKQDTLEITIYVYNLLGECLIIKVPVMMQFQSVLETGTKFVLTGANITDRNQVSYILTDAKSKGTVVVSTELKELI